MTDLLDGVEYWADIPDLSGAYQVSTHGRVRSMTLTTRWGSRLRETPLVMSPAPSSNGYLTIGVSNFGRRERYLVHRLVLRTFDGSPKSGYEAAHLNNDRTDNRLENLQWVSRRENHSHKFAHGTYQRGERCGKSKLSQTEVDTIRQRYVPGCRVNGGRPLSREFCVSQFCIQAVVTHKTWRPVTTQHSAPRRKSSES